MPWRRARWWSTRAKPRAAKGRRRSGARASSGASAPDRTSSRSRRRAGSSMSVTILPPKMTTVAFLGPLGTFTEEALLTQADLAEAELVPLRSFPEVLAAVDEGRADLGFVALENS